MRGDKKVEVPIFVCKWQTPTPRLHSTPTKLNIKAWAKAYKMLCFQEPLSSICYRM